jgi:TRAP-type C4-dicarboxylate transport system substrate-binding protein
MVAGGATGALAQTVLRVASYAPAGSFPNEMIIIPFLDRVVADSQGTLEYQLFPGGTLGRNPAEQLQLVQNGVADMALLVTAFTPGELDPYGIVGIPGLIRTPYEGSIVVSDAFEAGLLPVPANTHVVGEWAADVAAIYMRSPIESLDGLSGLRIRALGRPVAGSVEILGGVPTGGITSPETAEAISRGTVDGAVMGPGAVEAFRVAEVIQQVIQLPMGAPTFLLPMNLSTWESLPEPARAAFERHGGATFAEFAGTIMTEEGRAALERILAMEGTSELPLDDATQQAFGEQMRGIGEDFAARGPEFAAVYQSALQTLERLRSE